MFKFVAILAFVAAAVAEPEPGVLLSTPYAQPYAAYSYVPAPGAGVIQQTSVIQQTPYAYSSPLSFSHFINKRSADPQLLAATYSSPYLFQSPYQYQPTATVVSTPTLYNAPIAQLPVAAHLIKKRSAEPTADPQTYISSSYLTPSPYINTALPYPATPYFTNPLVNNYYPTAAAFPLTSAHLIKKRAADAAPEPAADPQLAIRTFPSAYYPGAAVLPAYQSATFFKTAPVYTANPFIYSSFIKK